MPKYLISKREHVLSVLSINISNGAKDDKQGSPNLIVSNKIDQKRINMIVPQKARKYKQI